MGFHAPPPPIGVDLVTTGWRGYPLRPSYRICPFWGFCLRPWSQPQHGGTCRCCWGLSCCHRGLSTIWTGHSRPCRAGSLLPWFEDKNPRWHFPWRRLCSAPWSAPGRCQSGRSGSWGFLGPHIRCPWIRRRTGPDARFLTGRLLLRLSFRLLPRGLVRCSEGIALLFSWCLVLRFFIQFSIVFILYILFTKSQVFFQNKKNAFFGSYLSHSL